MRDPALYLSGSRGKEGVCEGHYDDHAQGVLQRSAEGPV